MERYWTKRGATARKLKTDDRQALRAEAEARFARAPRSAKPNQSTAALLHELQVHQIELEMQNEELRRDQLEIEQAHERLVDLYDFAPVGYVTLDESGVVTGANLTATNLLGRDRKSLLGRPFASVVHVAETDAWHLFIQALARTGGVANTRLTLTRGDGTFDALLACERREGGPAGTHVRAVLTEVTELAHAERALRESEHWLRMSQRVTRVGHYVFEIGEDRWTSSSTLNSIFGIDETYPRRAADWLRVVHPEDRASMERYLVDLVARGSQFDQEYRVVDQGSGEIRWVHGLGELQRGPGGKPVRLVGTIQDITVRKMAEIEREALQGKLALASRLAAMGTLVAGVAHEINNPLAADVAGAGLALEEARELHRRLQDDSRVDGAPLLRHVNAIVEALEDATDGSQKVARIVKDLAAFANPDPKRTRVLLADVAATAIRWMPMALGQSVDIRVEDQGAPPILASAGQIEQVVVNLLTNAAKATPPGKRGDIVIRIGPGGVGKARLDVIDKGVGIDSKIRERIFEPFFTTRRAGLGRGAGLGLAICHTIVTDHGGTLTVESEPGKGSTFRLELPVAPAHA